MRFFENKRFFICESCKQPFEWVNHRKDFICPECSNEGKYLDRKKDVMKYEHDKFGRRTLHYVGKTSPISKENIENLIILRDKIMETSKYKRKKLDERKYLKWLIDQEDEFMKMVEKYRKEED